MKSKLFINNSANFQMINESWPWKLYFFAADFCKLIMYALSTTYQVKHYKAKRSKAFQKAFYRVIMRMALINYAKSKYLSFETWKEIKIPHRNYENKFFLLILDFIFCCLCQWKLKGYKMKLTIILILWNNLFQAPHRCFLEILFSN